MRGYRSVLVLLLCIPGLATFAHAEDRVQVRPIDFYLSGFGGYAFPFKADLLSRFTSVNNNLEMESSPSFGGKIGMWFTAPRKALGIDIGAEIDVTHFNPDTPGPLQLNATYVGFHLLARVPMGVTPELPNGRWFPYVGVGGGVQRLTFEAPRSTSEDSDNAGAFQGLWGVKVFLSKHIAVFGEGKYTHATHRMNFQSGFATGPLDLKVHAVHGVGGLSLHF